MKNILLSIDFSRHAQKLAICTAELAQATGARLILFHVYCADEATESEKETDTNSERYVQAQLDRLARKLHKETDISITRLMKPFSTANDALEIAKLVKADIAVMCNQNLSACKAIELTKHEGIPVITATTALPLDVEVFKQQLSGQLDTFDYSPTPLPETI